MNILPEIQTLIDEVEDGFASPSSYARLYRNFGMQVVPARYHWEPRKKGTSWKRPRLWEWAHLQKTLMSDEEFNDLYGENGKFIDRCNMGILTQVAPSRIVVLDLDTYKTPQCLDWWHGIHAEHNMGILTETVCQKSGGGGEQHFFICPEGWSCPTNKNVSIGVDSRGAGGFTMLPPSKHDSGNNYEWKEGYAPWEIEFEVMPKWMCDEIEIILGNGNYSSGSGSRVKTQAPEHIVNAFGKMIEGREDYMKNIVYARILDLYRECPIIPSQSEQERHKQELFEAYLFKVASRIHEPGTPKDVLLEREGRGISAFNHKWNDLIKKWDGKVSREASKENPNKKKEEEKFSTDAYQTIDDIRINVEPPKQDDEFGPSVPSVYKLYTMDEMEAMPPAKALVEDIIAENSLGFIFGAPGCGKTFIAMSLGLSIAYNFQTWFWDKKINKGGPVIYICSEGFNVMWNRMKAWKIEHGIVDNEQNFLMLPDTVNVTKKDNVEKLMATLKYMIETHPSKQPPAAIFVDTVSRSIAGAAENDAQEISLFIEVCETIKRLFNTNIFGIHHSGRSGTNMRGSSAFDGGADFLLFVKRDKTDGNLIGTIEATKIRAFEDGWVKDFELKKHPVTIDGKTSLVAVGVVGSQKEKNAPTGFGGDQETGYITIGRKLPDHVWKAIFDEAEQDWENGVPWSEFKQAGSRYAGTRISNLVYDHMDGNKISESDVDFIVKMLTGKRYMITTEYVHNKTLKKGLKVENRPS